MRQALHVAGARRLACARRGGAPRRGAPPHPPPPPPPGVPGARRSTSCHNGSGPLESAALMKTEEDKVPARPLGSTPLVRLQAFPSAVNCGRGATPPYSPYGIQMFLTCVACLRNCRPSPCWPSDQSLGSHSTHVRFMFPADARSTSAPAVRFPKCHTASTSSCSASTFASASLAPVTMLITPAGTSDAASTVYSSVAASGCASDGTATTVLPTATAGATSDTNPSSGCSSGQAIPITPMGSFMASVTPRIGV